MASLIKPFTQQFAHSAVPSLTSRHYLVTGGTNGIGLSVSRTLYAHGANVHIISHQEEVAKQAQEYIKTGDLKSAPKDYAEGFGSQKDASGEGGQGGGSVEWEQCNLEDLKDVARVAKSLAGKLERLDGAFLLAGKGVNEFQRTADGYE